MKTEANILRCDDQASFIDTAVAEIEASILALDASSNVLLGLSGGSTPRPIYERLASSTKIDWSRVDCFLIDERNVPFDHPDSNAKMISETLLPQMLLAPRTGMMLRASITEYEERMQEYVHSGTPMLLILGMGEDGHIASLFPGDEEALTEAKRLVVHTQTDTFAVRDRISVTLPFIRQAAKRIFLIAGPKKAALLETMQNAEPNVLVYPAQEFLKGETEWIIQT